MSPQDARTATVRASLALMRQMHAEKPFTYAEQRKIVLEWNKARPPGETRMTIDQLRERIG